MNVPGGGQRDVVAFLSSPSSYGPEVRSVERCQTHGSIVFLAGDRAYKLKRSVRYPYMDYSTPDRRRAMCERELAVNRRTAPSLYLGVQPIVRTKGGTLCFGTDAGESAALDWVVVMRRFDQADLFGEMRRAGKLTRLLMRSLAEVIAGFHGGAEVKRDFGGVADMRTVIDQNSDILTTKIDRPFQARPVAALMTDTRKALSRVGALLERRKQDSRVRRCHGDLHLNNICMIAGRPTLFDAIEFNDRISCIDVLYDLAFLLMDLDRTGLRAHANVVLNRYLELTGEHAGLAALPLFLSCRAAIRAHVTASAADSAQSGRETSAGYEDAILLLERAAGYLISPKAQLIALGGVSGTGKSTLARHLAPLAGAVPGAIVIRADVIRKHLMGVEETTRLPLSAYGPTINEQVYRRMLELASETLTAGHWVIVDGVFGRNEERIRIAEVARRAKTKFDGIWLEAPEDVLRQRIGTRVGDASDATVEVLEAQLSSITKPQDWLGLDTGLQEAQVGEEAGRLLGISVC